MSDSRLREFESRFRDAKFKKLARRKTRLEIDSRFDPTAPEFNLKWRRDRRGRKVNLSQRENYEKFYNVKREKMRILERDVERDADRIRGIGGEESSSESEPDSESEEETEQETNKPDIYDKQNDQVVRSGNF